MVSKSISCLSIVLAAAYYIFPIGSFSAPSILPHRYTIATATTPVATTCERNIIPATYPSKFTLHAATTTPSPSSTSSINSSNNNNNVKSLGTDDADDERGDEGGGRNTNPRNIFHNYDKPIVLVGCSSEQGHEMTRLAESFMNQFYPNESLEGNKYILRPTSVSESGDNDDHDVMTMLRNNQLQWPTILVMDFSEHRVTNDSPDPFIQMMEQLYVNFGLLSIYVNVDPESSNMSSTVRNIKTKLEENVFVQNSDYEVCIKQEGTLLSSSSETSVKYTYKSDNKQPNHEDWEHIEWELARILGRARLAPAIPGSVTPSTNTAQLTMGDHTFFLSLSFPDITQVEPYVQEMCLDVDAMEYRTDLLNCRDSRFDLIYGMQLLRKYCRPHLVRVPALPVAGQILEDVMPIVYTVRTKHQAGTYPDDGEGIGKMFDMLEWGLRAGVEVLDVESAWDRGRTDALLKTAQERYSSQILGSHHVVGKEVSTEEAVHLFQQCALDGRAHGAKVVLSIESQNKDRMAHEAALLAASISARDGNPVITNISLILGEVGQFSRIINLPFTPVTHESLPFKAAPGQLSASEIMAARVLTKVITTRRYAILGHNIAYSVSPQMQGAAFAAARLPHQYGRADVETVEEFIESDFFKDRAFGGCSVTIPHKQAIIPYVNVMSDAAATIGSVNTLIAKDESDGDTVKRVIYGDNTDWRGIFNPLERKIGVRTETEESMDYALILGGGGTARAAAYAASKLGLKRIYYNRTPSKAQDLADSFGGDVVSTLDHDVNDNKDDEKCLGAVLPESANIKVVISTLPAAAEFVLPPWLLGTSSTTDSTKTTTTTTTTTTKMRSSSSRPVIFDVNYKPFTTKLLEQAEEAGLDVVRGSEMLWEQGVGQFEAWTQRTAPYAVMKSVVLQNCLPPQDDV